MHRGTRPAPADHARVQRPVRIVSQRITAKVTDEDVLLACQLLIEGHAPKQIAARWGIHPSNLLVKCRRAGLRLVWRFPDAEADPV